MRLEKCAINHKVDKKEIIANAEAYLKRGLSDNEAYIAAANDKIADLKDDERTIVDAIMKAYEANGFKLGNAEKPNKKDDKNDNDVALFSNSSKEVTAEELIAGAKKYFGTTYNNKEAGYILPDGTMLDFTGRHTTDKSNWPYMRGERATDHREFFGENIHNGSKLDNLIDAKDGNEAMREFMLKTGAMRVDFNGGVASIMAKPTPKQTKLFGDENKGDEVSLTYVDGKTGRIVDEKDISSANALSVAKFFEQAINKPVDNSAALFSRSNRTKQAYDKRIDELFDGKPANREGVKVLDKSDMLDMLGYGGKPVILAEGKVIAGQTNHKLTADEWKKIPEWLENPAAVFDSETVKGSLVFIAPESHNGAPIRMILVPNAKEGNIQIHMLSNAYDAQIKPPTARWVNDGLLRYIDKAKSREFLATSRLQLPRVLQEAHSSGRRLLVDSDLVKYLDRENSLSASNSNKGMTVAQVNQVLSNDIFNHKIDVYASMADAPMYIQVQAKSEGRLGIEGFFDRQTNRVALIASNLTDAKRALEVARHELIGHYGIEKMTSKEEFDALVESVLRGLKLGNKTFKEVAAYVDENQPNLQPKRRAREIIAVMAERNLQNSIVKRVLDAVRTFLNKIGFIKSDIADVEVAKLLRDAQEYLKQQDRSIVEGSASFSNKIIGDTGRTRTTEQLQAFENVGRSVTSPTLKERITGIWNDAGKILAQGLADQFAPVKELGNEPYNLMRLSKGGSGAFETLLNGGQLKLSDNVYDFDENARGGVISELLVPLQGEADDFLWWVAANRAEQLSQEDREHLFTEQDIAAMKSLSDGQSPFDYTVKNGTHAGAVTKNRRIMYVDSLATLNKFNKNTMDMAEQSGLIDGESRKFWEKEFYVPFYRVEEDSGVRGMNVKSGVVRQQAFKNLKGGTGKLNSDLLENTLMNWAHLLDAGAKNRAAKATIEAAEALGIAEPVEAGTKKSVWYMDKGEKKHYLVNDPYIMTALSALDYAGMKGPIMDILGAPKRLLTIGVTASPYFKIRNLIRDSVQSIAVSPLSYNIPGNIAKGWKLSDPKSDSHFKILAGGGTIHFGTMLEGSESKRVRALTEKGVDSATILDGESKLKAFYTRMIEPTITAYNELGNRGEEINRASLYDQLKKQGVNHQQASLMARDLMDFSMSGSWTAVRFLTQVVPFMNARIQGLYKLGKATKENPAKFTAVLGATALMSIALMLAYKDDDDWKKREDWDRDNYWWFKIGGIAYRIPKPFEIGAIGTLAERGVEYFASDEMTGQRFMNRLQSLISNNLSMNPIPQSVKPILDVYANKDSFTGRPIESMGMENLLPEYRYNQRSSMTSRGLSTAGNSMTYDHFYSPVQIDHLIQGYTGWLGTFIVSSADVIARPATNQPASPTADYIKTLSGGMASKVPDNSSRYVTQMYEQANEISQAYNTYSNLKKQSDIEGAKNIFEEYKPELLKYKSVTKLKKHLTDLNDKIREIERSDMSADEKHDLIARIKHQEDMVARRLSPTH